MGTRSGLGELEQLVLLAILRLEASAFGPDIARDLEDTVDRRVSRGALYSTLHRLEEKGLVRWAPEDPDEGRKGHIRRRFELTGEGLDALRAQHEMLIKLWDPVWGVLEGGSQ